MDSVFDKYSLNLFKFFKRYSIPIIFFVFFGLVLGYFLDKNYNIKTEGIGFRAYFTLDKKIAIKYDYAYNLIEHLYRHNATVIINPNKINELGNAVKMIKNNLKDEVNAELYKLIENSKGNNINIFSNIFINEDNDLEYEFQLSGNNKIKYNPEEIKTFQNSLSLYLNRYLFEELNEYYKIYKTNSIEGVRNLLKTQDLNKTMDKFNELQKNIYDNYQKIDFYEYMYKFIKNEIQIEHNVQQLLKTMNEIENADILKLTKISNIKTYSITMFNIQFFVMLPILFFIFSVIFFLIFDEYLRNRK